MASVPGGPGHQGRGAPSRPARAKAAAGAGLCLALVAGALAGPTLADPVTDPGGSETASVGDVLRLPGAGSFDPLQLGQIALRPGTTSRTGRPITPSRSP